MNLGLVADCIDVRYEGDDDTLTWIRPAYTGKLFVKILTTTRPQLATISDKISAAMDSTTAAAVKSLRKPLIWAA